MKYNIQKHSIMVMRGRVALYHLLKAMGISADDEVIVQAFTCLAVPTPIILLGAKPVYVDIKPNGYTMDPYMLENAITGRTKAIIIQHTFGVPADIDELRDIAGKYNIPVIEDCCHAIASSYRGKELGTFGIASFYSTEWAKPVNTGTGGVLVLNDVLYKKDIEDQYKQFRKPPIKDVLMLRMQFFVYTKLLRPDVYWVVRDMYRFLSKRGMIIGTFSKEELESKKPDYFNYLMSDWQKKILDREISGMEVSINKRREIKGIYDNFFKNNGIFDMNYPEGADPVLLRYPLLVKNKKEILKKSQEEKVEIGNWFISTVHPYEGEELESIGYEKGSCPEAEKKAECCINLPMHSKIKEKELDKIFRFIEMNKSSILVGR